MNEVKLDTILQKISNFSLEDQYMIVQTITKRIHEARRNQIAERANEALANYHTGNVTIGTADNLIIILNND
ncbi:MAG: hypothetical protein HQK93_03925 [Nitrospirae bacterium]|nr:hypothetical protein [Nitrospirota bacterium]